MNNKAANLVSTHSNATSLELLGEILRPLTRVLVASGLTREQILEELDRGIALHSGTTQRDGLVHLGSRQRACMEIMCLWRRDRRFLASNGLPATLPVTGEGASFQALCGAANAPGSCHEFLETLELFGAVRLVPGDRVRPLTPTFLIAGSDDNRRIAADGVMKQIAGFMRVIDHNTSESLNGAPSRFERACTVVVAKELVPIFERAVRERGQEFIDVLDEWLERHGRRASESQQYVEIGAGAYFVDLGSVVRLDSDICL